MIEFTAAPPVPLDYAPLLKALQPDEITQAVRLGYVGPHVDPSQPVLNSKAFNVFIPVEVELNDWRARLFLVWFCYLYEEFLIIQKPLAAMEEILYEFQGGPKEFDGSNFLSLASLYAGVGAEEPSDGARRLRELAFLESYYNRAIDLLGTMPSAT